MFAGVSRAVPIYRVYQFYDWRHYNIISLSLLTLNFLYACICVCTLEPFPPPDDFRLRTVFLQRLWFTWTRNETYRNCASLSYIYLTNCTSTCNFSSDGIFIVCSDISTIARICLFQLQLSICDDTKGNASDPVYITLKGKTNVIIIMTVN